jgi:uncharacterized protein YgbK (DUF1537 family)
MPEGVNVLVVVGTANPISRYQARRLEAATNVSLLTAPVERYEEPTAVLDQIAEGAVARLAEGRFGALIATGGDTMNAILDRLNIRQFEVLEEFEPGFPLGRASLGDGRSLLIAMKAGGFGGQNTLVHAVAQLRRALPNTEQRIT